MISVRDIQLYTCMCYIRVVSKINRDIDKGTVSTHEMEMGGEVR